MLNMNFLRSICDITFACLRLGVLACLLTLCIPSSGRADLLKVRIDDSFTVTALNLFDSVPPGMAHAMLYHKVIKFDQSGWVCFGFMSNHPLTRRFLGQGKVLDPQGRVMLRNLMAHSRLTEQASKYKATTMPGRSLNDGVQTVPLHGVEMNCRKSRRPWTEEYNGAQFTIKLPEQVRVIRY